MKNPSSTWEQRWHPLREEWVVVAAHRQTRPWKGARVEIEGATLPEHDPQCHFCPRNERVGGHRNPDYLSTFAFDNDAPCVAKAAPVDLPPAKGIYESKPASGVSRVVCYSPRHDMSLARLAATDAVNGLAALREQQAELASHPDVNHVLAFENRGQVVGVSNPHPHCQVYATNFVFKTIENEARRSRSYRRETGRVLFQDIVASEIADARRVLVENDSAIAFVPYFARYPYEVFVAPKETHQDLTRLATEELEDLAQALRETLIRFDNLWSRPFPYVMALHQAPTDGGDHGAFHFHIELHPPMRQPDLIKYAAGPEIGGGNYLMDAAPEDTAAELRAVPSVHFGQENTTP